ncbi:MAG: phenylalanine--tRNA ligase subunit alpha [Candidatus Buchananbacteria bacterium]|nr:phenylalanine--tRNA ligase subunit alpha [Candidatus Buchananbacteria bacterium]
MKAKLESLKALFDAEIKKVSSPTDLDELEIKFLGRKAGELTAVLRGLKNLPEDQRKEIGNFANQLRGEIENAITEIRNQLSGSQKIDRFFDLTLPGTELPNGHLHLMTKAIREITEIFERIGFNRVRYPEVEWDWYAFEALNMPGDHPARDEWETFFIDDKEIGPKGKRLLTPHTSSGQVREMERKELPIRMTNISKCYRRQSDISHAPMFHQFEGLMIDTDVTIAHLKGVLDYFAKQFFGPNRTARIRPYHFQFTEPSFEVDISCGLCEGKGCRMCKSGWLEIGGAGMVHPNVLKAGKIDPKKYSGFAFGWGVERCYLMKPGLSIPDIRELYQSDLRFLKQF